MAAVNVNYEGTVNVNSSSYLHIRNRPSMSGNIIGTLNRGAKLTITKKDGEWYYATNTKGWSHSNYINVVDKGSNNSSQVSKEENEKRAREAATKAEQDRLNEQLAAYNSYLSKEYDNADSIKGLVAHDLNGIFGIPYQFMDNVDPQMEGTQFGRKYAERIVSKMPLLLMTPGKVEFMSNYSKDEQKGILADLIQIGTGGNVETDVDSIIRKNGKYFTFAFAYPEYFQYVNPLLRSAARYLGIDDVEIQVGGTKGKAQNFKWQNALNKDLKATFMSQEFVGFYMDSADQVSEEFSNETTKSQLDSTVNGFSDLGREIGFLLGAGAGKEIPFLNQGQLDSTMQTIEQMSNDLLNGSSVIKNIAQNFATVATGGKLLFPEIWADSQFSRSFDINIKLRTPDKTPIAWYMNIMVPLGHLIAFAAGHTETAATQSANSYFSPFLIRAYYKGLFNVDMGIITSMSITKGKEAAWTINGLPSEIDVSLTIKDLYGMLAITPGTKPKYFVNNTILMDYIANTCGVNINKMDIQRTLEIYCILSSTKYTSIPNNIYKGIQNEIDNIARGIYDIALNKLLLDL